MMKHVQLSPFRSRADTVSLSSTTSYGSLSPEPLGSRSSSYSSLSETNNHLQTTIKVYAKCLRPDIEYKTLSITFQTTCKEVVQTLLSKYKMKHRDPKLFYLSMEVTVRKAGVRTHLPLDDEARPAVLQSCHPKGDSKFSLQTRRGGLVKVHDAALNANSQYKSLLISARTTVDELLQLLLQCSNSSERVEHFSLYEVCPDKEQQRKLHPDDRPLQVQATWLPAQRSHFLIRRNHDYMPLARRKFFYVAAPPTTAGVGNGGGGDVCRGGGIAAPGGMAMMRMANNSAQQRKQQLLLLQQQHEERNKINNNNNNNNMSNVNKNGSASITNVLAANSPSYADYENYFYI